MKTFNPSSSHPARALQAWQILISTAMNRQIHSYKSLSELMYGKSAQGVIAPILGHIADFCNKEGLPPLTTLVVNESTGLPGDGIPVDGDLVAKREKVYAYDWYNIYPPTEEKLKEIYKEGKS